MCLLCLALSSYSQQETETAVPDTLTAKTDTLRLPVKKSSEGSFKSKVNYAARDSIVFDLEGQKVFLYGGASIHYEDIDLKADYIVVNFKERTVFASGAKDSTGQIAGNPVFSEGGHEFRSKTLYYNFDSRKGIISNVITQEGEGYLHGSTIKKMGNDVINIRDGKYTSCDLDDPHYEFRFSKSVVIPDDKIVTGPAYLSVAHVPLPVGIPFGLFPNHKGQRSGVLIPTYGESAIRGFYFENFGYYWGLSKYFDLELRGDVYTLGSWAFRGTSRYNLRYKFNGMASFSYALNKIGIPGSVDYQSYRDYSLRWTHAQSDKARPNSRFSANVNISSNKFNQFNPTSTNAYLSNTFQSSVTYQTNFGGKYFLTASLNHSQNTIQKTVAMTLPDISFSANRFMPFARKNRLGPARWYEKFSVSYQSTAQNSISTYDSLLFEPGISRQFRNGMQHSVSIAQPLSLLKYFNLTTSISYRERWYSQKIRKLWVYDTAPSPADTLIWQLRNDTMMGFTTNRDMAFSSSLATTVYGLVQFSKGPLRGIRHVLTPTVSFSYTPGFGDAKYGFYGSYQDAGGKRVRYSLFENAIYGSPPENTSGRIGFNLSNTLEIKIRSKKDSISGMKKIPIIENFNLSTSYDLARDSLRWSPLFMSGRTRLFKNIDISYSSAWDPYVLDSSGSRNLDQFEWTKNHRFFRLQNTGWNLSLSWAFNSNQVKTGKPGKPSSSNTVPYQLNTPGTEDVVDFNVPWNFSFTYSFRYGTAITYAGYERSKTSSIIQTLNFSGDLNLTPRWKIGLRSGYDFEANKLSYTSVDVYRDLHCWEMRFSWIPMGFRKSWNFTINVKSSLLQDLRLNKKKDFRDN